MQQDHHYLKKLLFSNGLEKSLKQTGEKILAGERISNEEGLLLFEKAELPFLGTLANFIREQIFFYVVL